MTSLLSALRNPAMIPGNAIGSESDLRAQIESLRVQLADANERAEKAERALMLTQSEVDDLTAQKKLWRRVPPAVATWWGACGFMPPFTPGTVSNNNDGRVRDSSGIVADCGGVEARADVIAALLTEAAERMKS